MNDILQQLKALQVRIESLIKDSSGDCGKDFRDGGWTRVPSRRGSHGFKSVKLSNNSSSQSIISKNKYSILSSSTDNLHLAESSLHNLSDRSLDPFVGHDVKKDQRKPKNNVTTRRPRRRLYQQKFQLEGKCDQMCDQSVQNIPTIVKGHLSVTNQFQANINNNNWTYIRKLVNESKMKMQDIKMKRHNGTQTQNTNNWG
jgi:hypothetical protein